MVRAVERRWKGPAVLACLLCCLPACVLWAGDSTSESDRTPVAIVESISGTVTLSNLPKGPGQALDPQKDVARLLHRGEWLQCSERSQVRLRLQSGPKVVKGVARWVAPNLPPDEQGIVSLAMQRLESGAVATDHAPGPIFSPAEGSSVRPDVAPIRWHKALGSVAFRLKNERGKVLWSHGAVSATDCKLDDPAFNAALREFRDSVSQGKLTLEALSGETLTGKVEFSLISELAEQSLKRELKDWGAEPEKSLLRYVGRAAAFGRRSMWNEEAEELEAAVATFPKSVALLRADRSAQLRTGNLPRAEALRLLIQGK